MKFILITVSRPIEDERRVVDLDSVPVHTMFKYQCSKYTDRIYLLTQVCVFTHCHDLLFINAW